MNWYLPRPTRRRSRTARCKLALGVLGLAILASACTGAGSDAAADTDPIIVDAEPTPETFDPTDPETLSGVSTSPSRIRAGECFNEYIYQDSTDFLQQITTIVGCDGPHDREAYFVAEYPAGEDDPLPADDTLKRWADVACLEEFEAFVGLEYVLSRLEIGAIVPTFETWTDEGDRNVICYVYPDEAGRRLRSSAAGSGI